MKKWMAAFAQLPLQKRLDSLTLAYEQNGYHGVILVAKGTDILYKKATGWPISKRRSSILLPRFLKQSR